MKRKSMRLLACMFVMVMVLSLSACGKEYGSVKEFIESEEMQKELDTVTSSIKGQGMDLKVTGKDNKLIYTYTFSDLVKQDGMAETLESGLKAEEATFKNLANSLKEEVDVDDPVVVVEYIDANGDEIYSMDFKAD